MQYFKVNFQYSEYIYCANIAHAENIDAVNDHYSKYPWVSVKAATDNEVRAAKRKGMPIVEIKPETVADKLQRMIATEDGVIHEIERDIAGTADPGELKSMLDSLNWHKGYRDGIAVALNTI